MRIGHQAVAVEAAERVLAQGTPSKESLAALQSLVAQEMTESSWTGSLKGELAGWHFLFTQIRNGKLDRTYLRDLRRWRRSENTFEEIGDHFAPTMMDHAPDCLRFMDCRIEISKLPLQEQKAKLRELEETFDKSNPLSCLTANGSQVLDAELRSQGLLRTTLVALACERYRLQHNNWPAQLDDLVAESFLPALPVDPVDGQALRYRCDATGVVIWSIGIDEKDDQGDVVRAPLDKQTNGSRVHRPPAGDDVGFRLWNPQSRRKTLSP
jgi:hypothetical protein